MAEETKPKQLQDVNTEFKDKHMNCDNQHIRESNNFTYFFLSFLWQKNRLSWNEVEIDRRFILDELLGIDLHVNVQITYPLWIHYEIKFNPFGAVLIV